jgi:hypothetical protein
VWYREEGSRKLCHSLQWLLQIPEEKEQEQGNKKAKKRRKGEKEKIAQERMKVDIDVDIYIYIYRERVESYSFLRSILLQSFVMHFEPFV